MHPVFEDLHNRYRKSLSGKDCDTCQLRPARSPRGASAPDHALPGKSGMQPMSGEELCACMRSELEEMDMKLEKCRQAFGSRPLAPHFIFGPLTADQWRRFHFVHGRHHLKQLARIGKQTKAA